MKKSYNEKLHARNASFYSEEEKKKVRKQDIIKGLSDAGYDANDELAIIFNALELIIDDMPESEHKDELQSLLNTRIEVKSNSSK